MPAPHEIIAAPYTLWAAPVGTTFPRIDDTDAVIIAAARWTRIGTSGAANYDEAGVTVSHDQSTNFFRGAGSTAPRKGFRTEEDLTIGLSLADLSPDQYAHAINEAAITTVAAATGIAGEKFMSLYRGPQLATLALLLRGMSTVDNTLFAQYEVANASEDGSPSPVFTKGNVAMLALNFRSINAAGDGVGFGTLRIQTAIRR